MRMQIKTPLRELLLISPLLFCLQSCNDQLKEKMEPGDFNLNTPIEEMSFENLFFDTYSIEDGLAANNSSSVIVDNKGFIWIGTEDGLNRFDGESFKLFRTNPEKPDSLINNLVSVLIKDSSGVLWVGTSGGGLEQYNKNTDSFHHHRNDRERPNSISGNYILSIFEDSSGILWVGTEKKGLNRFDRRSNSWSSYSVNSGGINSIFEDGGNNLWIGTSSGLSLFNRESGLFETILDDYGINDIAGNNSFLWLATQNEGLVQYDRITGAINSISLNNKSIKSLYIDSINVLWIGTDRGLYVRNPQTGQFIHLQNDIKNVDSIGEDLSSGIWFCTDRGVHRIERRAKRLTTFVPPNGQVSSILEDSSGTLWIGTENGEINTYTGKAHSSKSLIHKFEKSSNYSLFEDSEKNIWIGTDNGLYYYSIKTKDLIIKAAELKNTAILSIKEDRSGNLWIGTESRLVTIDIETEAVSTFSESINRLQLLFIDSSGELWIGTESGVFLFDKKEGKVSKIISHSGFRADLNTDSILTITEDSKGFMWFGTRGGLIQFNRSTSQLKYFREKNGLANQMVKAIQEDNNGDLWLSTNKGISKFNPDDELFKNYDMADGVQGNEFSPNVSLKCKDGMLIFGGKNSFNSFYPDDIHDNSFIPPVYLTNISQNGIPILYDTAIEELKEVTFQWYENSFDFTFTALNFNQPEDNYYAYKLVGFEDYWNYPENNPVGHYTNLPSGNYTLRLKGSNNDGIWNNHGAAISVIIPPPFWGTWWFKAILILIIIFLIYISFKIRIKNIENRASKLEKEVQKQIGIRLKIEKELFNSDKEKAVLNERHRLARELHDAVTQTLFSANLISEVLPVLWQKNQEKGKEKTQLISTLIKGALAEMRILLRELKPEAIYSTEMTELLIQLSFSAESSCGITVLVESRESQRLQPDIHFAFYRIAQEAINNIIKHSTGTKASIDFHSNENEARLVIRDNGKGFDIKAEKNGHFGLVNMAERAKKIGADFNIVSDPSQKTEILLCWQREKIK